MPDRSNGTLHARCECVEAAVEPVARSVDREDLGVVEEAVEDRGGERLVAEGVGPFADGLVGGDDRRAARVAAVDDRCTTPDAAFVAFGARAGADCWR